MELYYVLSIVDRNRAKEMQEIYENLQLSVVLTLLGKGTATSEHLSLYDLSETEKADSRHRCLRAFCQTAHPDSQKKAFY